jgi:hypothetical protein
MPSVAYKYGWIVKEAFSGPSRSTLIGTGLGGLYGVLAGRYMVKDDPRIKTDKARDHRRNLNTLIGGLTGAITGGMTGSMLGKARRAGSDWAYKAYQRNAESWPHDQPWAKPAGRTPFLASSVKVDPARHGTMGRVWQTVNSSSELTDPAKRKAAEAFMNAVGKPGTNVETLKKHMAHFPTDTSTGQMMNVLFNKHHAKTASYVDEEALLAKVATIEACWLFGINPLSG